MSRVGSTSLSVKKALTSAYGCSGDIHGGMPGCKRVLAHAPWTVVPAPTPPTSRRPDRPRVDARRGRASRLAPGGHDQESGAGHEGRPTRQPPTAARRLAGLATMPCGVSETGFAAIRTPLSSSVRRGNPRVLPRQVRGRSSEAPALGRSVRHAGQGVERGPRLLSERRSQVTAGLISEARA